VRRVTWRLELYAGWGARLDESWLPTSGTEEWRKIFEGEDMAGRVFAAGGPGINWPSLAGAAAALTSVLEQYRMHWRVADEIVGACPSRAEAHLATMAAPRGLRPPSRTHPAGAWRVCELRDGTPLMLGEYADVDLAEGAAVAHRTLEARRAVWTEPVASGAGPEARAEPGWLPRVDTDLRLRAFAVEDAVDALARAAGGRYVGPEVLDERLPCTIGLAAHHMIREYRTLLRAVWIDADECPHAAEHDAQAETRLHARVAGGTGEGPRRAVAAHGARPGAAADVGAQPASVTVGRAGRRRRGPRHRRGEPALGRADAASPLWPGRSGTGLTRMIREERVEVQPGRVPRAPPGQDAQVPARRRLEPDLR